MFLSSLKLWGASVAQWVRGVHPVRVTLAGIEAEREHTEPRPLRQSLWSLFRVVTRAQGRRQSILTAIAQHIGDLNESDVPVFRRCMHMAYSEYLARGAVKSVYVEYASRDENPESEARKELTSAAIDVMQQLARGYREILRALQGVSDNAYTLCQSHAWSVTHRVFELVQTEQYLCALRHMKLSEKSWRMVNQLYFSVHERAEVEQKHPVAGFLRKPARAAWQPRNDVDIPSTQSIRQLYVSIQVTGMIDPPSWSAQQFAWVQAYLGRSLTRLKLHAMSANLAGAEFVTVTSNQASAASVAKSSDARSDALQIDVGPLIRRIQHDINQQGKGKTLRHSQRNLMLATLNGTERWQLLERLQRKLRYQTDRDPRECVEHFVEINVVWGFLDAYRATGEATQTGAAMPPTARGANVTANDAKTGPARPWALLNESDGGLLFRFSDTRGMKPFFVGQLMAYSKQLDASRSDTIHLGYVARIQRDRSGAVDVGIQKIATEAECARLCTGTRNGADDGVPAFVARCRDGKWRIILHSRHGSYTLAKTKLDYEGYTQPLALGSMYLYQSEFVVFDLSNFDHM